MKMFPEAAKARKEQADFFSSPLPWRLRCLFPNHQAMGTTSPSTPPASNVPRHSPARIEPVLHCSHADKIACAPAQCGHPSSGWQTTAWPSQQAAQSSHHLHQDHGEGGLGRDKINRQAKEAQAAQVLRWGCALGCVGQHGTVPSPGNAKATHQREALTVATHTRSQRSCTGTPGSDMQSLCRTSTSTSTSSSTSNYPYRAFTVSSGLLTVSGTTAWKSGPTRICEAAGTLSGQRAAGVQTRPGWHTSASLDSDTRISKASCCLAAARK
jgi:hypothetical protein